MGVEVGSPFVTRKQSAQLSAVAAGELTALTTPWMLCAGQPTVRIVDEIRSKSGGYNHRVRFRTATASSRRPSAWTDSTSLRSVNGTNHEDFSLPSDCLWVQGALAVSSSTGAGEALASIQASVQTGAVIVSDGRFVVTPSLNSGQVAYYPLRGSMPSLRAVGICFAFAFRGVVGTLGVRPAARLFDSPNEPGDWQDMGDEISSAEDGFFSTGLIELNPADPAPLFAQAGIGITTAGNGTVDVLVAVAYD